MKPLHSRVWIQGSDHWQLCYGVERKKSLRESPTHRKTILLSINPHNQKRHRAVVPWKVQVLAACHSKYLSIQWFSVHVLTTTVMLHTWLLWALRGRRLSRTRISLHKHLHTAYPARLLPLAALIPPALRCTYPPRWRWLSCAALLLLPEQRMEAAAGGGHKHAATHADADAPSSLALTQQTSSCSSYSSSPLFPKSCADTPSDKYPPGSLKLWLLGAWRYTSTAHGQDWLHWHTPPPCTPFSLHLSPPPSPLPSFPSFPIHPGLLPLSPFFFWLATLTHWQCLCRWMLGMRPRVGPAVTPWRRFSLHSKYTLVTDAHVYIN